MSSKNVQQLIIVAYRDSKLKCLSSCVRLLGVLMKIELINLSPNYPFSLHIIKSCLKLHETEYNFVIIMNNLGISHFCLHSLHALKFDYFTNLTLLLDSNTYIHF